MTYKRRFTVQLHICLRASNEREALARVFEAGEGDDWGRFIDNIGDVEYVLIDRVGRLKEKKAKKGASA